MGFAKGNPGRPKGARQALGDAILDELKQQFQMHGRRILADMAEPDPKAFMDVCVKVLPKEINVSGQFDHNHSIEVAAHRVDEIIAALADTSGEARDVSEAVH